MTHFQLVGYIVQKPKMVSINDVSYYQLVVEELRNNNQINPYYHKVYLTTDQFRNELVYSMVSLQGKIIVQKEKELLIANQLTLIIQYSMENKKDV